ncbi:hypothetical protein ACIP98_31840 [Streptomyces sp. NPDC088354]|uniref:hypothetical protein n=1 Tax=unclassified Streptomyces TaxID=2593676 RepID=UPI0029ACD65B|nr:hypothetical protein [Streptomyces sp. MI02-7b]MDX3076664.1 hypothetical protein [Streptomyces sp. MI02-7b]
MAEADRRWRAGNPRGGPGLYIHHTLGLLDDFHRVGLVDITEAGDGMRWLTVPEGLHGRLRSRWSESEEADWHGQLVHNAFVLLKPGDPWWALPAGAGYWWRHLVWHMRYCDPAQATGLVRSPDWQIAKIRRYGVRSLLADLALVDSPESRATASVINEVMSGEEDGSRLDPGKLAELRQALSPAPLPRAGADHHAEQEEPAGAGQHGTQPLSSVRGVLQLPPSTADFALAPDGTWLVAVGPQGNIHVYDLEAQALRRVIRTQSDRGPLLRRLPGRQFHHDQHGG